MQCIQSLRVLPYLTTHVTSRRTFGTPDLPARCSPTTQTLRLCCAFKDSTLKTHLDLPRRKPVGIPAEGAAKSEGVCRVPTGIGKSLLERPRHSVKVRTFDNIPPGSSRGVIEITSKEKIVEKIQRLKKERNAIILAHNYQVPEVQDVGDYLGDSLNLSKIAAGTNADVIVFCGVDFMAESAKILSPGKVVIHPVRGASCPMAAMIDVESLRELQRANPEAATVAYVNTTAEVKAEVDICCTSSNAVRVVKSLPNKEIIFIPDVNLGLYVQRFVPEKRFIFWRGYCHVHQNIDVEDIRELKEKHPAAEIMVHPECQPAVIDMADHVYSTQGMMQHARDSSARKFILGTEREMSYRLGKENPDKFFLPVENAICTAMKKIKLEDVLNSLETLEPRIELSQDIIERARLPLEKMVDIGRGD